MINRKLFYIVSLLFALCLRSNGQTSENEGGFKEMLMKYSETDANSDGVLNLSETRTYKKKFLDKKTVKRDVKGGERHIYKTVDGIELPLYVFIPKGHKSTNKTPAIVFFHGGGWTKGSPDQFEKQCNYLAKRGMVAITVQYRLLSDTSQIEDCIQDAKSAMRWVRGNASTLGIDSTRIASAGGSAGGHLAACVSLIEEFDAVTDDLSISAKPNAMVLFNPAMALAPHDALPEATNQQLEQRFQHRTNAPLPKISPLNYADTPQPPCIMFFGTKDRLMQVADIYLNISQKAGNICDMVRYEGQAHAFFNNGIYLDQTLAETDKFLVDLGWLKGK
ncbi:MAG: alpha/beta hydrolase [Opitutales bacterium]|nr:alpha/beta hydrolase [Opitutales bacterium]